MERYFNSHDERVRCFETHMSSFRETYKGYTGKDIKSEWIDTARRNYATGVKYEDVVGLYDTSLFGKGKSGYLFTDDYLYWTRGFSKGIIKLSDIEEVTFYDETKKKDVDKGIIFRMKRGADVMWDGFCSVKCGAFIEFLEEYLSI